jgi:hypothetical protein
MPTVPQPGFDPRSRLDENVPLVVVYNISETFYEFLSRAEDPLERERLILGEQYRTDRALLWLGDPKLVFVTFPISHADYLCQRFGYQGTAYVAPSQPGPWLSLDILREQALVDRLVEYAGSDRTVQLIPYATTDQFLQLAEALRTRYGLNVLLPECPAPDKLWIRDYVDTKAGFRVLVSHWLPDSAGLLPQGIICRDPQQAARVAHWFCAGGRSCVIKADAGENGIGSIVAKHLSLEGFQQAIQGSPFLRDDWITVEEFIHSSHQLSPSLEMFVPPLGAGEPAVTYLSQQLFHEFGDFCGVLVSRELVEAGWYPRLAESGMVIATRLQEMGYVGHFDLDAIVDADDNAILLEINSRRTGGTHVHEFATFHFGPDYLDEVVLLSNDAMHSGAFTDGDDLLGVIDDLLYPVRGERRGVVIAMTSALEVHEFGCIIVAQSTGEALELLDLLKERIRSVGEQRAKQPSSR